MTPEFVMPQYRGAALRNVLPSIAAHLEGGSPVIDIPSARKYVIVMADGLGWDLVHEYGDYAEHLLGLDVQQLTCSVPSTTATSLTSLGCGLPPGQHGIVGYSFRMPEAEGIVNALTWENGPEDIDAVRQVPTRFETLRERGYSSAAVTLARFDGSSLTQHAFAGTELVPRPEDESDIAGAAELVRAALEEHDVVYCYQRLLDHAGHTHGVGSWQWLEQLEAVDELAREITALANDDVCVLVTGDHGMINVPDEHRIVAEDEHELDGYELIGGEGRFRQLYGGNPTSLKAAWGSFLGERAEVLLRAEAIEAGWFGEVVADAPASRIGDVVVAMRGDWAVMSRAFPNEFSLVGMHGSLTAPEMFVPLFAEGGKS